MSIERAKDLNIKKLLIFTANGEGAFKARELIKDDSISILATTFPYKKQFVQRKNGEEKIFYADTSNEDTRKLIKDKGITLIQGTMPFQEIIIPGTRDTKLTTITRTLSLISGGIRLCIESVLMACDSGFVEQGEYVVSMSADTSLVVKACRVEWLFHPEYGLEIAEIICKPNRLDITHNCEEDTCGNE